MRNARRPPGKKPGARHKKQEITPEVLYEHLEEINYLLQWFYGTHDYAYTRACELGGVEDAAQLAWVHMLKSVQNRSPNVRLPTFVINSARWSLAGAYDKAQKSAQKGRERQPLEEVVDTGLVPVEDHVFVSEIKEWVHYVVRRWLTCRHRRVIELRFGLYDGKWHTLEEAAKVLGVTRERVCQLEWKAIRQLYRRYLINREAKEFGT